MGVARIRANLGAFRGDLSLFGDGAPSAQNEHSDRARSKRHFVALVGSRPQNEVLIFGSCDRQRSTPQNEALKRGSLLKIKSSQ